MQSNQTELQALVAPEAALAAAERTAIITGLRGSVAAEDKADKAKVALAAAREETDKPVKAAADYFKGFYPTLDDMMSPGAEADIKAAIREALPDEWADAWRQKEAKQVKTPTELLKPGVTLAEQQRHMALAKKAQNFSSYQTTYLARIREAAFPTEQTNFTKAQAAMKAAFKRHVSLCKSGLPANITPAQAAEAKAMLVKLTALYGVPQVERAASK